MTGRKTPVFGREVPPTWWSWPALLASSVLAGLLVATYVREPGSPDPAAAEEERRSRWWGGAGGLLTFFAVGCPVCNKLVLLALGAGGAMTYFEPVQPGLSGRRAAPAGVGADPQTAGGEGLCCAGRTDRAERPLSRTKSIERTRRGRR